MEEKQDKFSESAINDSLKPKNIIESLKTMNKEIIHEKICDQWLFETTEKTIDDYKRRISLKENHIEILNQRNLESQRQILDLYRDVEKINTDVNQLKTNQNMCDDNFEQLKKALKICILLKQKIDSVNTTLVNDVNKFNAEYKTKAKEFTNQITQYEFCLQEDVEESDKYNEYSTKLKTLNFLSEELDKEKNNILQEIVDHENAMEVLLRDAEDVYAQKKEIFAKVLDCEQLLEVKNKELEKHKEEWKTEIENLQKELDKVKIELAEVDCKCKEAQNKLDEQNDIMNATKERNADMENTVSLLEKEYKDLENQYKILTKNSELELEDLQLMCKDLQSKNQTLDKQLTDIKSENLRLENKLKSMNQTADSLNSTLAQNKLIYNEIQSVLENATASVEAMKHEKEQILNEILEQDEKVKIETDAFEAKLNALKEDVENRGNELLEIQNKIERVRKDNNIKDVSEKDAVERLTQEKLKLEEELRNVQQKKKEVTSQAQEKLQKLMQSSNKEIKSARDSLRSYKSGKENDQKLDEQELNDRKKSLSATLKKKELERDELKIALAFVRNEIKKRTSEIATMKYTPGKSEHVEKFLADNEKHLNEGANFESEDMLDISPIPSAPKRRSAIVAQKQIENWRSAWSGSTTEEMLTKPTRKQAALDDSVIVISNSSMSDSDSDNNVKKRTIRHTKGGKVSKAKRNKK